MFSPERYHDSKGDSQLLQTNQRSSNLRRRNLYHEPSISIYGVSPSAGSFLGFVELTSALYIGTVMLNEPTPIPVTNLPPRM